MTGFVRRLTAGITRLFALRSLNEELQQRVSERTAELEEKNRELDRMNKLFVGRELRMVELKEQVAVLLKKCGLSEERP